MAIYEDMHSQSQPVHLCGFAAFDKQGEIIDLFNTLYTYLWILILL